MNHVTWVSKHAHDKCSNFISSKKDNPIEHTKKKANTFVISNKQYVEVG